MLSIFLIFCTTTACYSKAKKVGASKIKWASMGALVSLGPIIAIQGVVFGLTGKNDFEPLSFMGTVIVVMILSAVVLRQIKPK